MSGRMTVQEVTAVLRHIVGVWLLSVVTVPLFGSAALAQDKPALVFTAIPDQDGAAVREIGDGDPGAA